MTEWNLQFTEWVPENVTDQTTVNHKSTIVCGPEWSTTTLHIIGCEHSGKGAVQQAEANAGRAENLYF